VWAAGDALHEPFAAALAERLPGAVRIPRRFPPVAGAVLLAMGAATAPLPPDVLDRLEAIR